MPKSKADKLPKIIIGPPIRDGFVVGLNVKFYNRSLTFGLALDPRRWVSFGSCKEDDLFCIVIGPFGVLIRDLDYMQYEFGVMAGLDNNSLDDVYFKYLPIPGRDILVEIENEIDLNTLDFGDHEVLFDCMRAKGWKIAKYDAIYVTWD